MDLGWHCLMNFEYFGVIHRFYMQLKILFGAEDTEFGWCVVFTLNDEVLQNCTNVLNLLEGMEVSCLAFLQVKRPLFTDKVFPAFFQC